MKKRIVSSIMCLAMLLSLLPVGAFAASGTSGTISGVTVDNKPAALVSGKTNEWEYKAAANSIPQAVYGGGVYANYLAVKFTAIKDTNGYYILCKDGKDLTESAAKALITAAGAQNVYKDAANHEVVKASYFEGGDGPTLWLNANTLDQTTKKYVVYQALPKASDSEEGGTKAATDYDLYKHTLDFTACSLPVCDAFTQHTDTTPVWNKNLNTLVEEDFKVEFVSYDGTAYNEKLTEDSNRGMTIKLSGTVNYMDGWTGFSSDKTEQSGHYVAIDIKNPNHNDQIKQIVLNGTKERTFEYSDLFGANNDENGTIIVRVDDLMKTENKFFTLTYKGNYPTAEANNHKKIATFKFDCSGLKLASAPTGLEVRGYDGSLAPLGKNGSDLQTNIKAGTPTTANGVTTIPFTGSSKYIFNWTEFSGQTAEQSGNYVALKLTAPGTIKVDGNALDEDGLYVVILNGTKQYKNSVTVTTKDADKEDVVTNYVLDFTGVDRLPATISSVANKDSEDAVKAKLMADGKIALSGIVTPEDGVFSDITLNVKFSGDVTKEVTVKIAKNGDTLTATAVPAVVANNTLSFDTSMLAEKKDTAAEAATVAPPAASVSDTIPAAKLADATAISDALTTGTTTKVDEDVLQKYADISANDAAAKDTLLTSAAGVVADTENAANVPSALKTAIEDAAKSGATDTQKDAVTTVVQVYTKIEVTDVETTGADASKQLTSFKISIIPMAQTVVTTVDAVDVGKPGSEIKPFDPEKDATGNTDANAIIVKEEPVKVNEPTEVVLALPAMFTSSNAFIEHVKDNVGTFIYIGTVNVSSDPRTLTFTSKHGFSDFTISTTDPSVAKIDDVGYKTLAEAIAAANDGDTIALTSKCTGDAAKATVALSADKTVTFTGINGTVTINGKDYPVTTGGTNVTIPKSGGSTPSTGGGGGGVSSNVTVDRPTNGKVTVTPTAPSKGATVTVNLTPDAGYQVGTVTVTDKDGNAVELTKVNDTQYTFVMPDGKVTVKATFTQVETPSSTGFTDVAADAYYADAVKWAVEKGITNGLTATTFGPNNSCTRGQMVTFLWRAAGSPAAAGTNSFSDVASGEYYYDAVLWAVEKGITNGTSATTFSPNATVNRGQTVTFLYRYAESPAATGTTSFTDVAADAFYADAVKWAVAEEITNGTSSTTFSPASNCTRGQIVTFMYRQMAE